MVTARARHNRARPRSRPGPAALDELGFLAANLSPCSAVFQHRYGFAPQLVLALRTRRRTSDELQRRARGAYNAAERAASESMTK